GAAEVAVVEADGAKHGAVGGAAGALGGGEARPLRRHGTLSGGISGGGRNSRAGPGARQRLPPPGADQPVSRANTREPRESPPRRRERLARQLSGEGLDALLVSSPVNVTYLTGFTGDSSALVLTPSRAVLVSDPRYVGQIADECPDLETNIRTPTVKLHDAIG